jgi:sarcosine oxidase
MAKVIVVGLGAMGSAAAQHLAERGHQVLAFDRFTPPHTMGSSHGQTRMIRQAYWEDSRYIPLVLRAYELWRRLERDSGRQLLHITGGLVIGRSEGTLAQRSKNSADAYGLSYQMLTSKELMNRFPAFTPAEDGIALWEEQAGYLVPEDCIGAQLERARIAGAKLQFDEPVVDWRAAGDGVMVRTVAGVHHADRLVLTAGPWSAELLREMSPLLNVTRQIVYWFEPKSGMANFRDDRMPVYLMEGEPGERVLYGFPAGGAAKEGVKVALHGSDEVCSPHTVDRSMRPSEEASIRRRIERAIPSLGGRLIRTETCLYTMTPDEHFIIDHHPKFAQVTVAAGFSGHGFKFANAIGEAIADLCMNGSSSSDLGLFAIDRFKLSTPGAATVVGTNP